METDPAVLTIDIISDVVCPWCYVGKRRLEQALARRGAAGPAPKLKWHPFQLNPELPVAGMDRRTYLERKFGGSQGARAAYARVEDAGRDAGIAFAFERIARQPNTLAAHRLIAWAQQDDSAAAALVERLFRAYFLDGLDIGAPELLVQLAGESGLDARAAAAWMNSDAGGAEVKEADREARRQGVGGVPFFIINQRIAVSGAQAAEALLDAFRKAGDTAGRVARGTS